MKKSLLIFTVLVFACSCCSLNIYKDAVKGNGKLKTSTRNLPEFDSISVSGGFDVNVKCGEEQSVVISCDENLLFLIITEVKDGKLDIYTEKSIDPTVDNEINICVKSVKMISSAGSSDFKVENISSKTFLVDIAGSSDVDLYGETVDFTVEIAGSGDVDAKDFAAENVTVDIAGSGDAIVFASKKLHVDIAGSGDVLYCGNPEEVTKDIAGSGTIKKM